MADTSSTMTPLERNQVNFLLGPFLIGGFIDFMLQGILFSQFARYFSWYKDDKTFLRSVVAILLLLTTLKTALSFGILWEQLIVHFKDIEGSIALSYTSWYIIGSGLMTATIGLYVQTYFCYRLYAITRRVIFVVPIAVILLFAFVGSIMSTYYTAKFETKNIGIWYACHLSAVFAGDTLLATTTAVALLTSKSKHGLKSTNDIISALVRLTWQTITPAAICALLNLIFSQLYNGEKKLVSAAFNSVLPKLYAMSMIWTLNARRAIRANHSSNVNSSLSSGRARRRDDVELSRFGTVGTIHIRTDIESDYIEDTRSNPTFADTKQGASFIPAWKSSESRDGDSEGGASYKIPPV